MERRVLLQNLLASPMIATGWRQSVPHPFETGLLEMMQVAPVPGAVTGALQGGKIIWIRGLGVRDFQDKQPVTADTIFQAASLSKQVTAYVAFALRQQGKLDFDKPLVAYVDDLPDERARTVTPRHVLSHSSGFPNWRSETGQKLVPEFTPGERFQYSGEGFFFLQRVMEQVSGQGFGELVNGLVFSPLGMKSSAMMWKPEFADRFALPHDRRGGPRKDWDKNTKKFHEIAKQQGKNVDTWKYADYEAATREMGSRPVPDSMLPNAAASMVTSAADYAKFLAAAIKNPEIGKEQVKIRPSLGWGLGWGIERTAGREYLWQWGDNGGYKNFVAMEQATGDAIFIFTNGDSGRQIYDRIVTHATGHDHPALFWV
jgi:CubicO group peptidase (beta-lactamase class C family)